MAPASPVGYDRAAAAIRCEPADSCKRTPPLTPTPWAILAAAAGLLALAVAVARPFAVGRRWPLWLAVVAAASFVSNVVIARARGFPEPRVQDEFSYLLAADTFAHGRLANPTPPAAAALQSFHVLTVPTYASKYPPGQGLALALGQATTGMPIVGAWVATAALAAAVGWAVAGLSSPTWGVGAAVLVALHPQVVEWGQTYWGGGVAALGGALVLGGWVRATRRPRWTSGAPVVLLGVGLGVLLNSRPYEGAAYAVPFVAHLLVRRPRALLVAAVTLLPFVALTGVYNAAVTGRPWRLPYLAYEHQYAAAPPLLIGTPRPVPADIPAAMRAYAEQVELPHFEAQRSARGFAAAVAAKVRFLILAALPSPWLWPLAVVVPWAVVRDPKLRVVAISTIATLVATLLSNWSRTQYVAPVTAAVAALLAAAATRLPAVWAAAVVGTAVLSFAPVPAGPTFQRDRLAATLDREPGRQLVLVRYVAGHRVDDEWVYNGADPPSAKIVWARDDAGVPPEQVRAAYPGRTVWHLDVGTDAAVRRE